MKTETISNEPAKRQTAVISCRPNDDLRNKFEAALAHLGVDQKSELARRALSYGIDRAANEMAEEQKEAARELLKKLRRKISLAPITTSSMWGREWVSPVLSPVV